LVRVPHRQQRRAIVAVHGRGRRGDRRVKQGRGGVYRHFTNATATIVISHTQADYRHFRFTPRYRHFDYAWRGRAYRQNGFTLSSLWIRFFVRADSPRITKTPINPLFSTYYKTAQIP
jgi:hypothetical protein